MGLDQILNVSPNSWLPKPLLIDQNRFESCKVAKIKAFPVVLDVATTFAMAQGIEVGDRPVVAHFPSSGKMHECRIFMFCLLLLITSWAANSKIQAGASYVALSRVRSLNNLYVDNLQVRHIVVDGDMIV